MQDYYRGRLIKKSQCSTGFVFAMVLLFIIMVAITFGVLMLNAFVSGYLGA
jgi:hypothetical protein